MMRSRRYFPLVLALVAAPLQAQERPAPVGAADSAAAVVAPVDSAAAGPDSATTRADTTRLRLGYMPYHATPARIDLSRLGRGRVAERRVHDQSADWERTLDARLAAARDSVWTRVHQVTLPPGQDRKQFAVAADTTAYLPVEAPDTVVKESLLPGGASKYAELGMQMSGRGEMGGAWQRFTPCDANQIGHCEVGIIPQLRPDVEFGVLLAGTVTDRVHVSVDYDQRREFDASNNINVYYQGLEDEILQRVEVGDVAITLPQSQYLTGGVPGGNFGFRALGQVGPLQLQTVWAQQKGDVGTVEKALDNTTGGSGGLYDDHSLQLDDWGYTTGRFFFLVDPQLIQSFPAIDVLALQPGAAGGGAAPRGETLQLYRAEKLTQTQQQQNSEYFEARAAPAAAGDTLGALFIRIKPSDYVVHQSGLWIMLRQPLGPEDMLAVSYVSEAGDTVGTLDAENAISRGSKPVLRLLRGPEVSSHYPGSPTWDYEMHQVYTVSTADVDPNDVELDIVLGDVTQGAITTQWQDRQVPFIRLFGLDEDQTANRLDPDRLYQPSRNSQSSSPIPGTFLVFPTLRPFATPPAVPSEEMSAADAAAALGANADSSIYVARDETVRHSGNFRLAFDYRTDSGAAPSQFSLGAFGIRENSERVTLDGTLLERGADYTIDYETGLVTLVDPQRLFANRPNAKLKAQFEQNALFQVAPRTLFGTTARYDMGEHGALEFVGLYQGESTIQSRPELGNEPSSIWMGGVTGQFQVGAGWMDRALDRLPGLRLGRESSLSLTGEMAMSLPNPNTQGVAFLDDFEATAETPLSLNQRAWRLGSRPSTNAGDDGALPTTLDVDNAFQLIWQHQIITNSGGLAGGFVPDSVDRTINTVGQIAPEPVMYLTMLEDSTRPRDEKVWRSMTTVISQSGKDLTSSEALEFYAANVSDDITLIIDMGEVGEDAFFIDSIGQTSGTRTSDGRAWGLGTLDREVQPGQSWSTTLDQFGLWNESCRVEPGQVLRGGDPDANCTVNNGLPDSEDLNADGVGQLQDGAYFRYVVHLDSNDPYVARDTVATPNGTGTRFRLFHIPLRDGREVAVNGANDETWRHIQYMRITVTSGRCHGGSASGRPICYETMYLTHMNITGSRWMKRQVSGVLEDRVGENVAGGLQSSTLQVGSISQLNSERSEYIFPPGSGDAAADRQQRFANSATQINEKALRLRYSQLAGTYRGEVYYQFPQQTRSLMKYRTLRFWALPRSGDWGPQGSQELMVKLGTDEGNYYLYRTHLDPAPIGAPTQANWQDVVVDMEPWMELKASAEEAVLLADSTTAGGTLVLWNADSTYAIVLRNRSQAPNLASVREMSFAVYNGSGVPQDGELWLNDLRLGDVRDDVGFAGAVTLDAQAADFANVRFRLGNQGGLFQQLNRDPSYEGARDMGVTGTFQLGHFAPAGWGLNMPFSVTHSSQARAPLFLNGSDIDAARLDGLRTSGNASTQLGLTISKTTPSSNPLVGLLLDGTSLALNYTKANNDRFTAANATRGFSGTLNYRHQLQRRELDVTPGFFASLLAAILPSRVEKSEFFERLTGANLRWTPSDVSFQSTYYDQLSRSYNYSSVIRTPRDSLVQAIEAPRRGLDQSVGVGLQPFESLRARLTARSSRDLLPPERAVRQELGREAIRSASGGIGGLDLGWESSRNLATTIDFQPVVSSWLRPGVSWDAGYGTSRSPNYLRTFEVSPGDSTARMQRDFRVSRDFGRTLEFNPGGLVEAAWGKPAPGADAPFVAVWGRRLIGALTPLQLEWSNRRESNFERADFEPGYGYRLGVGELRDLRGDTAAVSRERDEFQATGGVRFGTLADLQVAYEDSRQRSLNNQGGDNDQSEVRWPDLRLRFSSLPIPDVASAVVTAITMSTGYNVGRTQELYGNTETSRRRDNVPVQVNVVFANGTSAGYTGAFSKVSGVTGTGDVHGTEGSHTTSLRTVFDPPAFMATKFKDPINASLSYTYHSQRQCSVSAVQQTGDQCPPRIDNVTRSLNLRLETLVGELNVGSQLTLNDRKSWVNQHDGSRQWLISVYAQFNFGVGTMPSAQPGAATQPF